MARLAGFAASVLAVLSGPAAFAHTTAQPHTHAFSPEGAVVAALAALGYIIALTFRLRATRQAARAPQRKRRGR